MSKICPICKQVHDDDEVFCGYGCGVRLIPMDEDVNPALNLGDANAISGGVSINQSKNISTQETHFHTTTVERVKSESELKHEKELAFREECLKVYSNGIMTSEGKRKLDDLRYRLGLDENSANKILSEVAKRSERKSSSLSPVHQITYNNIKTAIIANRLDLVDRLMAQLKAMVQRYSAEEIQFTYYMLQAVLHPKECTEEYESHYEDKYWQTFWSSIAYRRLGNIEKSELLVADVGDKWTDTIPQENVFVLASVNALIDNDIDTAKSLFDNISGEHSPYLSNLKTCLYILLYGDILSSEDLNKLQKDAVFYASNLFAEINSYNLEQKRLKEETERLAEEKKKQEEAEARRLAEEMKRQEEAKRIAEENTKQASAVTKFDTQSMLPYIDEFGYLRKLDAPELAELKSVLLTAPKNNYQAQFLLGQLYLQEKESASNLKVAYDAIKKASEHGIYVAGAFMAFFYLYGKVVSQDLDEAERRIKIDDDFKKNPIFVQMMIDLYTQKGNAMLADVWKSKLKKLK